MWIGLALLTPFLNYLWKAIPSLKEKLLLIISLFVMTSLPDLCNRYGMYVFPAYFAKACYPLMFYFIGTFIREYQPIIKTRIGLFVIFTMSSITPLANLLIFNRGGGRCSRNSRWTRRSILLMDCSSHFPYAISQGRDQPLCKEMDNTQFYGVIRNVSMLLYVRPAILPMV